MLHFFKISRKIDYLAIFLVFFLTVSLTGCTDTSKKQGVNAKAKVKAMNILVSDVPVHATYTGEVKSKNEILIRPNITGKVVEKYIAGGQYVKVGTPLFRLDSRQHEMNVLAAKAALAEARLSLANLETNVSRSRALLEAGAIAEISLTNEEAQLKKQQAVVDAKEAMLQQAENNLADTVVYATLSGQLDLNDVAVGTFAVAGQTTLVSMGTIDPIYVEFNISENEYLKIQKKLKAHNAFYNKKVSLTLSDGTAYEFAGKLLEINRELKKGTGTLTLKAVFPNPHGVLLAGMFGKINFALDTQKNAILVPERAVQQLLDKTFVLVVGEDNKSKTKSIVLGDKVGSYYIVQDGLTKEDLVIVEGLTRLQEGIDLDVTMVEAKDMGFSLKEQAQDTLTKENSSTDKA